MTYGHSNQTGAVLPVALFILTIVTLVGVSTLNTSNIGLRMAQNEQGRLLAELAIDRAVAQTMDNTSAFLDPQPQRLTITGSQPGPGDDFFVRLSAPTCLYTRKMPGYSALNKNAPELTYWEFTAEAIDAVTGARVFKEQGVRIRLPAFNCA